MNSDGSGQTDITNNPAGDFSPDWGVAPSSSAIPPQTPLQAKVDGAVLRALLRRRRSLKTRAKSIRRVTGDTAVNTDEDTK